MSPHLLTQEFETQGFVLVPRHGLADKPMVTRWDGPPAALVCFASRAVKPSQSEMPENRPALWRFSLEFQQTRQFAVANGWRHL